jgi:hypothetical protein
MKKTKKREEGIFLIFFKKTKEEEMPFQMGGFNTYSDGR